MVSFLQNVQSSGIWSAKYKNGKIWHIKKFLIFLSCAEKGDEIFLQTSIATRHGGLFVIWPLMCLRQAGLQSKLQIIRLKNESHFQETTKKISYTLLSASFNCSYHDYNIIFFIYSGWCLKCHHTNWLKENKIN